MARTGGKDLTRTDAGETELINQDKEKDKIKKAVEKPADQYKALCRNLDRSAASDSEQKDTARVEFFKLYNDEVEQFVNKFHDEYGKQTSEYTLWGVNSKKYEIMVRDYLRLFRGQTRFGLGKQMTDEEKSRNQRGAGIAAQKKDVRSLGMTGIIQKRLEEDGTLAREDEENAQVSDADLESNISDKAKNGVREISKWLYRNCDRRGIGVFDHALGESHSKFVRNFVMTQPTRVKLLAFYLIEKRRRKAPDYIDVMASQVGYEPDLDKFKDKMTASKFKFWKRMDGSYIYWDKLAEGMGVAREQKAALSAYADLGGVDSVQSDSASGSAAAQGNTGTTSGASVPPALVNSAKARKAAFDEFIIDAVRHRELLESKAGKNETKVSESINELQTKFNKMKVVDRALIMGHGYRVGADKTTTDANIKNTTDEKEETAMEAIDTVTEIPDKTSAVLEKLGDKAGEYLSWNIAEMDLKNMFTASGALSTVAGITSFVSACIAIANLVHHAGEETTVEIAEKVLTITKSMADIASTTTTGAYAIKNAGDLAAYVGKEGTSAAVNHASKASGAATIVAGLVNIGLGGAQMWKAQKQSDITGSAVEELENSEMDPEKKKKAARIKKSMDRKQENAETEGTMKVVAGTLQVMGVIFDASLVGAPVGTILNGIASGISLATSIGMYFKRKSDRKKTIDEYVGLDEPLHEVGQSESILEMVVKGLKTQANKLPDGEKEARIAEIEQEKDKSIKEDLREEIMVMMGYASINAFFEAIMDKYAQFLYENTFYTNGDARPENKILQSQIGEEKNRAARGYAKMLEGAGIKAKYPTKPEETAGPSLKIISKKLQG